MVDEYGFRILEYDVYEFALIQTLYERGFGKEQIIEQLCRWFGETPTSAGHFYNFEKNTRAPVRALQDYLEKEKGFPLESRKTVFEYAASLLKEERGISPEEFYNRHAQEIENLKTKPDFLDMSIKSTRDVFAVL